jgi:ribosomal protein L30/L7E
MTDTKITVVQTRSHIDKVGREARVSDTPANRGMIKKIAHLVRVVEGQ